MPELPEVETIVRELRKPLKKRVFTDVWSDARKIIKKPKDFNGFKKGLLGKRIENIERRGKNIIFILSHKKKLLIHQKMTGHLLLGKWARKGRRWESALPGPMRSDPYNKYLHLIFWLDNGKMLALSDLRKFAKVELWDVSENVEMPPLQALGPDPLETDFNFEKFRDLLKKKKGKIKQVLMDQSLIAGIGNIYSDEILFEAGIHPLRSPSDLSNKEAQNLFKAVKKVLQAAVKMKGTSFSDYRRPNGRKGFYEKMRKVYRRNGEGCFKCKKTIERIKVGGRSAHFCPKCQRFKKN